MPKTKPAITLAREEAGLEFMSADTLLDEYVSTRNETPKFDFTKNVQYAAATDPLANFIEVEVIVAIPKTQNVTYVP